MVAFSLEKVMSSTKESTLALRITEKGDQDAGTDSNSTKSLTRYLAQFYLAPDS